MDIKDTLTPYRSDNILLSDSNYYKYIFKKTEKICCAVFYILEHTDKGQHGQHSAVADDVREAAKRALDAALATLACRWYAAHDELFTLLHALFALESRLRVAQAAALLQEAVTDMVSLELEAVMRTLRPYLEAEKGGISDFSSFSGDGNMPATAGLAPRARKDAITDDISNARSPLIRTANGGQGQSKGHIKGHHTERRRAIKDTLAVKGQVTIKDILAKLPDFSEKTLQRELISMIHDGVVVKDGERRWRRYSLVPGV